MSAAPVVLTPEEQQLAVEREAYRKFKGVYQQISAKAIRDWVRAELIPPALLRLYRIGMGVEKFKIPTQAGHLVDVEAFASVQVDALSKLVDIGVPRQLGLVDNTDGELPGIMALGTLDLEEVQAAHEQRYLAAGNGDRSNGAKLSPSSPASPAEPGSAGYNAGISGTSDESACGNGGATLSPSVRAGGYEIVEVEQETFAAPDGEKPGEVPPPAVPQEPTLAQQILARRRAARRNGRPSSSDETP